MKNSNRIRRRNNREIQKLQVPRARSESPTDPSGSIFGRLHEAAAEEKLRLLSEVEIGVSCLRWLAETNSSFREELAGATREELIATADILAAEVLKARADLARGIFPALLVVHPPANCGGLN